MESTPILTIVPISILKVFQFCIGANLEEGLAPILKKGEGRTMAADTLFFGKDWVAKNRAYYDEEWVAQHLRDYLITNRDEWAYCPKCGLEWNTEPISWFGLFLNQPARHLVKTKVEDKKKRPDRLCPFHGECFMTGKRMGKVRLMRKRTLDKMNEAGRISCPNCKSHHLKMIGQNERLWACSSCNCFIVIKKVI
jgi:hypothetical protein